MNPAIPPDAYVLFREGNQWCAIRPDHRNLQVSPSGFGETADEAIARLEQAEDDL